MPRGTAAAPLDAAGAARRRAQAGRRRSARGLRLQVERIDRLYDPEQAFVDLFGDHRYAFWLDSSKVDERSRFSFMGASGGPLSVGRSTYDVGRPAGAASRAACRARCTSESIFDYLSREMKRLRYLSDDLPFDFNCGFVGYFGYELKADCEGDLPSPVRRCPTPRSSSPTG